MSDDQPLSSAGDGRATGGRFGSGNKFGKGNPSNQRAQKLRSSMLAAVTKKDMREIIKAMVKKAIKGDAQAAKLVLSYTIGKPIDISTEERLATLEAVLSERGNR